jgi:hypothetical protein
MAKEVTIQGVLVSISEPYAEGATINAAEAKALNQMRAENIGNNVRAQIKALLETEGNTVDSIQGEVQAAVTTRDNEYEFTLASVGGGSTRLDPLTKEARKIAADFVMGKLRANGITKKAYAEQNGEDAFMNKVMELADHEAVQKAAKKTLKDRESLLGAIG